ncbi:MAG: sulfite exporter TauE/SafE family protein [Gammaproteobacteria bacterium]|jgi:uncharacterized membrane protein YfcA
MFELFITIVYGCIVGVSLGLTGGGGSIFAIPLLVYGLNLSMTDAVPISLIAVALTAAVGAWYSHRARLLTWQPIFMFSIGGIIGAPVGLIFARQFLQSTLITGFAILTFIVGLIMWGKTFTRPDDSRAIRAITSNDDKEPICKLSADGKLSFTTPCAAVLIIAGLLTGLLSGLFGVGGGFLIVPALMSVIELGIHRSVAASLMIITAIGLSGSASAFIKGEFQWEILLPFITGSIIGMLLGRTIAVRIAGPTLQRIFASAILITGINIFVFTLFL